MEPVALVLFAIAIAVVIRLIAGSMDGDRIANYVRERGGKLRKKHWAPFGKGWFGEKNDRIYEVEYENRDGEIRRATVKTSMFSGVYLTGDRAVHRPGSPTKPADDEAERLRAENARLVAEVERLKQRES